LIIVGSDFYLSYWSAPGKAIDEEAKSPGEVLAEALQWLKE
jgi:hypothetical protein